MSVKVLMAVILDLQKIFLTSKQDASPVNKNKFDGHHKRFGKNPSFCVTLMLHIRYLASLCAMFILVAG